MMVSQDFQFAKAKQLPIQVVIADRSQGAQENTPSLELSTLIASMAWFPQMLSKQLFNTRKNRVWQSSRQYRLIG